jgi:ABC-2 type transport system ATP-binding protein
VAAGLLSCSTPTTGWPVSSPPQICNEPASGRATGSPRPDTLWVGTAAPGGHRTGRTVASSLGAFAWLLVHPRGTTAATPGDSIDRWGDRSLGIILRSCICRRLSQCPEPDALVATTPIAIDGLTKRYDSDVLAVDDLNLSVESGSVFGLLGPNGAGKTTTMRMLVGLIHPTSGQVRIFGDVAKPGAPVLRRVGVLVEGPGFVPHLSGRQNLELFWRAGRASMADAHLDDALDIADLGDAANRKYKTYSHGMRQRLGLAQALLGSPDLLVLDEPTDGLDPQQMRQTRVVLRRVAEAGTTVLVSSHLLSEVEQVCDHVAVMNKGRLVTTGAVSDLLSATTAVYLEVDDVPAARRVLDAIDRVGQVAPEGSGLSVELDGIERREVVAALVRAGVGVETITARHHLEDAFIGLLEHS